MSVRVLGDAAVVASFKAMPGDARSRLRESIGASVLDLQARVISTKLSGQVLRRKAGTLAGSIDQAVVERGVAITGTVGTNVEYARRHEYGFEGEETVKAHLRQVKVVFGKKIKSPVWAQIQAFTRSVKTPERSFLRSTLGERAAIYIADMEAAVGEAIK